MSREMWYLTRASGIVAAILMVAALAWGFFFSSRATGKRLRPAWWLDLHNWLGGLALSFTAIHVAASWLDSNSGIGVRQIVIPGTATLGRWGITWGVLALYSMIAVVFTTWPRRLSNRRWWRVVHLTSVLGTALALLHTYLSGSDATRTVFQVGLLVSVALSTYALGLRLAGLGERRRSGKRRSVAGSSQPALSSDSAPADYTVTE